MEREKECVLFRKRIDTKRRLVAMRGKAEHLIRYFLKVPPSKRLEYSLDDGEMEYSPQEIEWLAGVLGLRSTQNHK